MTTCRQYPHAVLLDMDGTLLDTGEIWFEAQRDTLADLEKTFTREHDECLHGKSVTEAAYWLIDMFALALAASELEAMISTRVLGLFRRDVKPMPGAMRLLAAIRAGGLPCALVSSSYRPLVDVALSVLGPEHFQASVSGDEVSRPKPAPQAYWMASALLDADPRCCLVVEDSPPGVAAGLAAGCTVIAVPPAGAYSAGSGAHAVVRSLDEIIARGLMTLRRPR